MEAPIFRLYLLGLLLGLSPLFAQQPKPFLPGNYQDTLAGFQQVGDVVVGPDLTIYATDRTAGSVRVFDPTGKAFGDLGETAKHLSNPVALAIHDDKLLVVDQGEHGVVVFDIKGKLIARWGKRGSGDGELMTPSAIAARDELVFIADTENHRVVQTDLQGKSWRVLGAGFGSEGAHLISPLGVACEPGEKGRIYVADSGNNRVVAFNHDGSLDKSWGTWGGFDDMLDQPSDLRFTLDHLYVTDRRNHRIHTLTATLERVDTWGVHELFPHEGKGRLHYPQHFDVAPDRSFAVVSEPVEDRLQRFISRDAAPPPEQDAIYIGMATKRNRTHFAPHLSTDGQLLLLIEPENHFLVLFDLRLEIPVVISQFSERGTGFGLMIDAHSPIIDAASGKIFIADAVERRIQEFRFDYDPKAPLGFRNDLVTFARAFDFELLNKRLGQNLDFPFEPQHMALGPDRSIYMLDQRNRKVFVFKQDMTFARRIDLKLTLDGPSRLEALCLNTKGNLYIADSDGRAVHQFTLQGQLLRTFQADSIITPVSVAVDETHQLYVTDRDQHRILKLSPEGKLINAIGEHGAWMGELWKPMGVAIDAQDRLIVVDQGNHRGQIFELNGKWLVTFGLGLAYTHENPPKRPEEQSGAKAR